MDSRAAKEPAPSREQLDELEKQLRPVIAKFLEEPADVTIVAITCAPVLDDPAGASVLRFEVKVRGQDISSEQEKKVAQLLRTANDEQIAKAKAEAPVY